MRDSKENLGAELSSTPFAGESIKTKTLPAWKTFLLFVDG